MKWFIILLVTAITSCNTLNQVITYPVVRPAEDPLTPPPSHVIVLNTYDVDQLKVRDKKDEVIREVIDDLLQHIKNEIVSHSTVQVTAIPGVTAVQTNRDSVVNRLMNDHQASHAIVITFWDTFFDQTKVDVTRTESGKEREASYDIVCNNVFAVYNSSGLLNESTTTLRKYYTSRAVVSGLLSFGPSIVSKKPDVIDINRKNAEKFLGKYFPSNESVNRTLFTSKEFNAVGKALARKDYEAAFTASNQLTSSADPQVAAMAFYNCAILMERKHRKKEAQDFLQQSLAKANIREAVSLKYEFDRGD